MKFKDYSLGFKCISDSDSDGEFKGFLTKYDDGYYCYFTEGYAKLSCKECRMIAEKLSELNRGE